MKTELLLPNDDYTERLVLGGAMLENRYMDTLRTAIEPDDFATRRHRSMWTACCALYDAGADVAAPSVFQQLQRQGEVEENTLSYLAELISGNPATGAERDIEILKSTTKRRRMMVLAHHIQLRCADSSDNADAIHEALLSGAQELGMTADDKRPYSTRDIVDRIGIDELICPKKNRGGLRLPWRRLSQAMGGLRGGQMVVVAAYTSRGKSSLACQISVHATQQDTGVFYWTTEMSPEALYRRMVDQMAGIDGVRHRESVLNGDEIERAKNAVMWLYDNPIWFDRTSRTVPCALAALRQVRQKYRIGLVVVDHLQHVKSASRFNSRAQEVADISRGLKMAALDLDVPFLVVSQVSRPKEDNQPLTVHMLKESGDVENDADAVLLLNGNKPEGTTLAAVNLNVAKQREGPAGFNIPLVFHPGTQSFEELN